MSDEWPGQPVTQQAADQWPGKPVDTGVTSGSSLPPEAADHGRSERQKLSPVGMALSPITSWPETYNRMNMEAQEQVSRGAGQVMHPDSVMDVARGVGNVAAGSIGYVGSPISATYRSIAGQPIEDITGIPREYTEFAAQLATPGLGLAKSPLKSAPDIVPVKPEANGPLGVTLSEGQQTHDLPAVRRESAARTGQLGSKAEATAKEFAEQQAPQINAARETVERGMDPTGGQVLAESPYEAAEMAGQTFRQEAARSKAGVTAAYNQAKDLPGEIDSRAIVGMGNTIKNNIPEDVIVDDQLTPFASKMIQSVDDGISKLRIQNRADQTQPDPSEIVGVSLRGLDQVRKKLSEYRSGAYANSPTDGRAASAVLNAFDDRIDQAVNSGMFNGDPRAVKAWNDARAAHADYKTTFGRGKNDPVGGVIQKIIGDRINPPETANALADHLYGASGVNPSDLNIRVAQRMKQVLGESSPEWAAVRQGLFRRLVDKGEDVTPYGSTNIANRLNKFLTGDGRDMASAVFTPEQRSLMKQYADLHRALEVPRGGYNSSETSTFVAPMMKRVTDYIAAAIGGAIGHVIAPGFHGVGEAAGALTASKGSAAIQNFKNAKQIEKQMPIIERQMRDWQNAIRQHESGQISKTALTARTLALSQSLDRASAVFPSQLTGAVPSAAEGKKDQGKALRGNQPDDGETHKAHGGSVTAKARAEKALPTDHQLGMRVPKGGSSCASCRFLKSPTQCGNAGFQRWNHSDKLPAPKDQYCCDLYQREGYARGGAVHNHNPSEAQKQAGNYAKTHRYFHGLDVTLENLKGHSRSGVGKDGKRWSVRMPAHYGYLKRTEGADGDQVDVYLGPNEKSDQVFVVDQKDADSGRFDEHKVLAGFNSEKEALSTYRSGFSDGKGAQRIGHVKRMGMAEFKTWLAKGNTSKPIRHYAAGGAVMRAVRASKGYEDGGSPELSDEDQAAMMPETYVNPLAQHLVGAIGSVATLPKRAIDAAKEDVAHYNEAGFGSDYMPKTLGPATETAMTMMGGAGVVPAEVNSLRAGLTLGDVARLPMDEASRLGRAAEQGYTIDAFKGGQPHDWNTMPEYYGNGKVIPGTENRVPQELTSINSPNAPYAGFFSNDPAVANRFAEPFEHGAVWPTKLRFDNPLVIDAEGKHAAAFQFDTIAQRNGTLDKMEQFKGAFGPDSPHDGVILKNTKDEGDVYVPRDSDQIRSRFAAFDPASKGSGMLLGSGATDSKLGAAIEGANVAAQDATPAIQKVIRAYHGSPHDFDKFSLDKIGTGEGAQAYGHGLYFAENEGVAKSYRDALAAGNNGIVASELRTHGSIDASLKHHQDYLNAMDLIPEDVRARNAMFRDKEAYSRAALEALKKYGSGENAGKMYEVNINADPEHFLDWDKPLKDMSPAVQQKLKEAWLAHPEDHANQMGEDIYRNAEIAHHQQGQGHLDRVIAAEKLKEAGIPGIKYLDQGSRPNVGQADMYRQQLATLKERGASQSAIDYAQRNLDEAEKGISRNYVVFNDKLVNIMRKYKRGGEADGS